MPQRVLVAIDESVGPLSAVRALRDDGFVPYVATARGDTYGARSSAVEGVVRAADPGDGAEAHVTTLAAAARDLGVAAVLPASEASMMALAGREADFAPTRLGTPPLGSLRLVTDKAKLGDLVAPYGLRTPPGRLVEAGGLDDRFLREMTYPSIVKPARTVDEHAAGRLQTVRAVVVHDAAALRSAASRVAPGGWLVQPMQRGGLAAVSGVAWRGRMVSALHQSSPVIWPSATGTTALAVTEPPDPALERDIARLLADLEWSGIYNMQFLVGDDGRWLIDFNPRVYGSIALAVVAGHNLPALWARLVLGGQPSVAPYRVGVGLRVEERLVRARLGALLRRRPKPTWPAPSKTYNAVLSLKDPAPVLAVSARAAARLRARLAPGPSSLIRRRASAVHERRTAPDDR